MPVACRYLDDVEAELRFHQVADLPGLHRERGVLELRHHAAAAEVIEVAALGLGAFVLGVLLRQGREIAAGLHLREDAFGFLANRGFVLAIGLEQDVARLDLFRRLVLLDVVVVVALRCPRGAR